MENDKIQQAYENFIEFLSSEKGDRNTGFEEVYLNNDIYLFLKYKNIYYFIVHKTIKKHYDDKLQYPIYKGIYWEYEHSDLINQTRIFVETNRELLDSFRNKRYINRNNIEKLYNHFWNSIFNTNKIKLNFHCNIKNRLIKAICNKIIEWFILKDIRKKYKKYITDKNPTKQSVYVLKNNRGKK